MAKRTISLSRHTAFSADSIVTKREALRAAKPCATTAKVVNYTPEQTAKVVEMFRNGLTPQAIGEAIGKSARSIVAKLSREKNEDGSPVYTAKTYKTKTGAEVVKKEALADKLTQLAGLTAEEADSLTKANKTALVKLVAMLEA